MPASSFVPDAMTLVRVLPLALGWALTAAAVVSWLHARHGVCTPYTRKIFHFLIIGCAALVQLRWGVAGVVTYAAVVTAVVLAAVVRGNGFAFYEALARPSDAPHRTMFILVPLATTALGGGLANLFFPAWAHIGYLAVAVGDAVGEPVGTRWGRHRYRVPSFGGVSATRTLEGSAAVFLATAAAVFATLAAGGLAPPRAAIVAVAVGAATSVVEAISHHGLDNLFIQIAAAAVATLLL